MTRSGPSVCGLSLIGGTIREDIHRRRDMARLVSVAILEVKRYAGAAEWVPVRRWPQEIRGQVGPVGVVGSDSRSAACGRVVGELVSRLRDSEPSALKIAQSPDRLSITR